MRFDHVRGVAILSVFLFVDARDKATKNDVQSFYLDVSYCYC